MMDTAFSSLPQEGLWRVSALLTYRPGAALEDRLVQAIGKALEDDDRLARLVVDRSPISLAPEVAELFPPLFDALIQFWFDGSEGAAAVMARLDGDPAVRDAAEIVIDRERSLLWLAQVFPIKREEGRSRVKFLAGGDAAEGWSMEKAQRYWRDVHPVVARTAPTVWEPLTRYVQFHGVAVPAGVGTSSLGRWRLVPMCAEMGFADARDFVAAYSNEEYRSIVRPDEEKFSRPGEMLAFVSGEERVLVARR